MSGENQSLISLYDDLFICVNEIIKDDLFINSGLKMRYFTKLNPLIEKINQFNDLDENDEVNDKKNKSKKITKDKKTDKLNLPTTFEEVKEAMMSANYDKMYKKKPTKKEDKKRVMIKKYGTPDIEVIKMDINNYHAIKFPYKFIYLSTKVSQNTAICNIYDKDGDFIGIMNKNKKVFKFIVYPNKQFKLL